MAAAKADNMQVVSCHLSVLGTEGASGRNADTDLSRSDRCFSLRLVELADGSFKIQMGM